MSKVRKIFWHVFIGLIAMFLTYMSVTPVINPFIMIVFVVAIIGWVWLPVILLQWYMWSKD